MSYIGNPIVSTDFPKDTFSGNGSTTAFTMQIAPASVNSVIVVISGITQDPSTYTISGTTLTFSAAPPTGTSNISVRHLGVAGTPNVPATASVGLTQLSATGTPSSSNYLRGDNTWASVASSQWTTSGSDIYYNTGKVGVGTSSPSQKFVVYDATGGDNIIMATQGNAASMFMQASGTGDIGTINNYNVRLLQNNTFAAGIDTSKNFQFNSGYGSVATAYGCRAWVNFYGAAGTIRASGGVSSITRNGTGDYTVNLSITLPDYNYTTVAMGMRDSNANGSLNCTIYGNASYSSQVTTTSVRVLAENDSGTRVDPTYYGIAIFR